VRPIIDLMRDDPRPIYIDALGRIGDERALDYLLALAPKYITPGNRSNNDVATLAEAIARLAQERALSTLMTLSQHSDATVRAHAARGLAKMKNPVALARLHTLMQTDDEVAPVAIDALGYMGTKEAAKALARELRVLTGQYFAKFRKKPVEAYPEDLNPSRPQRIVRSLVATRRASAVLTMFSRLFRWRDIELVAFQKQGGHIRTVYTDMEAVWQLTGDPALKKQLPSPTVEKTWSVEKRAAEYSKRLDAFVGWWLAHQGEVKTQADYHLPMPKAIGVKIQLYED